MGEEELAQIFQPFFTTKDPGRDGLGLAVCHTIVTNNGGSMAVSSKQGAGTSVEICFPAGVAAPSVLLLEDTAPLPRGNETILLVDDQVTVRESMAASLRELGYQVFEAAAGDKALELVRSGAAPEVDILVTDGRMPKMGGRALAREIHALFPNARILFLSGYPAAPSESGLVPGFGAAVLPKPFTRLRLAHKLRELLAH
jgi:CheY-like chemotaxis protein